MAFPIFCTPYLFLIFHHPERHEIGSATLVSSSYSWRGSARLVVRVLDALHVALSTHALYVYLIDMFGDLAGVLVHSVWYVLAAEM